MLLLIDDVMRTGEAVPRVSPDIMLSEALLEVTRKGLGMTAIVDGEERLLGIFTDGDLRRAMDHGVDVHTTAVKDVMTRNGKTVRQGMLAAEALQIMESAKINGLMVVDDDDKLIGALNMHDLLRAGVV